MLDHVSVAVRNLQTSADAYEQVLDAAGLRRLVNRPAMVGFGKNYPEFWLNARTALAQLASDTGIHICLRVPDEDAVRMFHATAMRAGWKDAGAPGPRQGAMTVYYAAFVQDPDGNKLEAATFPRKA
ncbi:MAG TPA: VOC family protein [Acetobacteraceae bacterium]|jgi:catechol 2,3-dioxygenase-like lactoylglutathione lyase family enzyme|nr:VOC family protein [Acetobacteraceae bacterium]